MSKKGITVGLRCPYCRAPRTRVTDSRPCDDGAWRRRRRCMVCGLRMTTLERVGGEAGRALAAEAERRHAAMLREAGDRRLKGLVIQAMRHNPGWTIDRIARFVDLPRDELMVRAARWGVCLSWSLLGAGAGMEQLESYIGEMRRSG